MILTLTICILGWQGDGNGCRTASHILSDMSYGECMAAGEATGAVIGRSLLVQGFPNVVGVGCKPLPDTEVPSS